jgi:hypothetical protein
LSLTSELPSNIDPHSIGSATLTLRNTGSTNVSIAASFAGPGAPYMAADLTSCSSPVAPHSACFINVAFTGPAVGFYSATLTLKDTNSTFSLPVTINANTSNWQVTATPGGGLTFGNQALNTTSAPKTFTIADPNGYPLGHPYSVVLPQSSNFVLTQGSTCPASTTQTCTLAVAFAPSTAGTKIEFATITDQTTGLQSQISLYGVGGGADYTLSTNSVTFPSRSTGTASAPISVALTSTGTQTLTVSNISIAGAVNNNFTQTNNCSSVPVNSVCAINITFAPTATGPQSATLQINSNAVGSPTTISITGTATP